MRHCGGRPGPHSRCFRAIQRSPQPASRGPPRAWAPDQLLLGPPCSLWVRQGADSLPDLGPGLADAPHRPRDTGEPVSPRAHARGHSTSPHVRHRPPEQL